MIERTRPTIVGKQTQSSREGLVTVPVVLPAAMRATMQRIAALRSAQGRRQGRRPYSTSALVRDTLAPHLPAWVAELRAANLDLDLQTEG